MSAFIGKGSPGERPGIWVTNGERDALIDWFIANRCQPQDEPWKLSHEWLKDSSGLGLNLDELPSSWLPLIFSEAETSDAAGTLGQRFATLLRIVAQITRGEWTYTIKSDEAISWWTCSFEQDSTGNFI